MYQSMATLMEIGRHETIEEVLRAALQQHDDESEGERTAML